MAKTLRSAVLRQLNGTLSEKRATLRDVASHGADGGFGGFIYYNETCAFARRNRDLIVERLREDVSNFGVPNVPAMIKGWRSFKHYHENEIERMWVDFLRGKENEDPTLENSLAWYALESVAHDAA